MPVTDTLQDDALTTGRWYSPSRPPRTGPLLAATDGTAAGETAVHAGGVLAAKLSTDLQVLLVVEPLPVLMPAPTTVLQPLVVSPELLVTMRETVSKRAASVVPRGVDWKADVTYGRPGSEIAAAAARSGAQLIVLGHVHHSVLDRILDGETSLEVARRSTIPLFLAAPDLQEPPKQAVFAVDFSPESMEAAREALRLVADHARIILAHVAPPPTVFDGSGLWEEDYETVIDRELRKFQESLDIPAGMHVERVVFQGRPASALAKLVERSRADLIAIGTRGAGLVQKVLVGTNTARIVHHARCSVLIAPRREQDDASNTT